MTTATEANLTDGRADARPAHAPELPGDHGHAAKTIAAQTVTASAERRDPVVLAHTARWSLHARDLETASRGARHFPSRRPATGPSAEHEQGHGRRLTRAFDALEALPALSESRNRLLAVVCKSPMVTAEVVAAVESDIALTIAVLRMANKVHKRQGKVDTVAGAVALLSARTIHALGSRMGTFDFFERSTVWEAAPERLRLHALATHHAAQRIATEIGYEQRDRLTVTSLLHDIGKLVLLRAYSGYPSQVHQQAQSPEERVHQERRELGVDHALVGGVLTRRWGLPPAIASAIERHHNPGAEGEAAILRLADMLAHYTRGGQVAPAEMLIGARALGIDTDQLRGLMYELPAETSLRRRHVDPCPLSGRELGVLQRLAEGKVYKQIAHELTLSTSTVRTHLHNIYGKLGAVDRAQAVLIATDRGWL
jgi:putative nucleotidyltransferase with HDIG domain